MDSAIGEYDDIVRCFSSTLLSVSPTGELSALKRILYLRQNHIMKHQQAIDFDKLLRYTTAKKTIEVAKRNLRTTSFLFNGSGTNGVSNTIEMSDFALNALCEQGLNILETDNVIGQYMPAFLPYFHPFGFTMCLHAMNCFGGCNVLMPKFDRKALIKYIAKGEAHYIVGVPTVFSALLAHKKFVGKKLKNLKACFVGGDFVPHKLIDEFDKRMIESGSICRLLQGYGPSENGSATCENKLADNKHYTCGKPLPCVKYRVFDEETQMLRAVGVGEMYISSDTLFNGYYKAEDANAQCIYIDSNGERWLKSGDIMQIDADGYVTHLSRKKRMIKVSGFAVFPSEIEQQAANIKGIIKTCAIGIPDKKTGHRVVLYYETNDDTVELKEKLKVHLRKTLEPKAVPIEFIYVDRIPLTPYNKTDVNALRKMYDESKKEIYHNRI